MKKNTQECTCIDHVGETVLPATTEFFYKDNKGKLTSTCNTCMKLAVDRDKANLQRAAYLKIHNDVRRGRDSPHLSDLTEEVVEKIGGLSGMADRFWADYADSPKGSSIRLNYWRVVGDWVKANTEGGYADKPVEEMSDDELKRLISEGAQKYLPDLG
jgi:hypothetical protein